MNKDLIKQFNLPPYIKDKSFAEASKLINNKFKDREDSVSTSTRDELLERLAKAQEYTKMQQNLATNSESVPDMMEGQVPEGMEQFAFGGNLEEGIDPTGYLGAASGLFDIGNNMFGDTGIDTSGAQSYDNVNVGGATANSALKGAQAGLAFGPIGAGIGAVVGGVSGLIGGKKKNKDINEANTNNALAETSHFRNDFKLGGPLDDIFKVTDQAQKQLASTSNDISNSWLTQRTRPNAINDITAVDQTKLGKQIGRASDWLGENYGNIATYAPIVGNAFELNNLKRPNTDKGTRLTNTYEPQRFDTNSLVNKINQNDVNSALTESSGGNLGALRSNILAANVNKTEAISNAMQQGEGINREENRFKFQSDLNRDHTNARLDESYIDRKARDEGAYQTHKAKLKNALYEDIGKVGQDVVNKKLVKDIFGYTWNGKYYIDKNGKQFTQKEVALQKAEFDKVNKDNKSAYGGYLKK